MIFIFITDGLYKFDARHLPDTPETNPGNPDNPDSKVVLDKSPHIKMAVFSIRRPPLLTTFISNEIPFPYSQGHGA